MSDADASDPAEVAARGGAAQVLIASSSPAPGAAAQGVRQGAGALPGLSAGPAAPPGSRYAAVGTAIHRAPDGTEIVHFRRRHIPPPEAQATIGQEEVRPGDRADLLAARAVGDPTRFWQLCDANLAFDPAEIEQPGRLLRVALPAGFPGRGDA